jgi:hypothetical protein
MNLCLRELGKFSLDRDRGVNPGIQVRRLRLDVAATATATVLRHRSTPSNLFHHAARVVVTDFW